MATADLTSGRDDLRVVHDDVRHATARHAVRRMAFLRAELERSDVAQVEALRSVCEAELAALTASFAPRAV